MSLENVDLDKLRKKISLAYQADDPIFLKYREYARRLKTQIKKLQGYAANALSFVSTDGGDNRLNFNPAVVELVRVVDSKGHEHVLDAIASTATLSELDKRITANDSNKVVALEQFCKDLNIQKLSDLSYLLNGLGKPGKSTGAIRCYRDIVEWAVLYDLANPHHRWAGDTIIVRDGLLRTKSFKLDLFPIIDKKIRQSVQVHSKEKVTVSIVGVAKQSAVLSRLALALELEATFHKSFPCYVEVPKNVEEECYNFDRTWLTTYESSDLDGGDEPRYQSMGKLFLVKFGDQPFDPVWPVDIAVWQSERAEEILGQLMFDAQQGFPIPNYPMCIQKAHQFAQLTGIEINVLQDLLIEGIAQNLTEVEANRLFKFKHLSQSLAKLRYQR